MKHCRENLPSLVTGQLLGLDVDGTLQVTNCFPSPQRSEDDEEEDDGTEYQYEMMRCLREVNVDYNTVGWYQSCYMGAFLNETLIETQFNYQESLPKTVLLIFDPMQSSSGNLSLKAYRLTDEFMALYKAGDFSMDGAASLSTDSIVEELPVVLHNPLVATAFLTEWKHRRDGGSLAHTLELNSDAFLEKNLTFMNECLDELTQEQLKLQMHQRNLAKQQYAQKAAQEKRRAENDMRKSRGEELLPETADEIVWKPYGPPPSKLDTLIVSSQLAQYTRQINGFATDSFHKLLLTRGFHQDTSASASVQQK